MRILRSQFCLSVIIATLLAVSGWAAEDQGSGSNSLRDFGFVKVEVPTGWHVKEEQGRGTRALFVTKESIEHGGSFQTGLSVNAIRDIPVKTGMTPSVYAKSVIATLQRTKESRGVAEQKTRNFLGARGFFRSGSPTGEKTVLFSMAMGNDATGSVFFISFESPESEWEEAWKIGEQIVRSIDGNGTF